MQLRIDTLNNQFRPLYDRLKHPESFFRFSYRRYFLDPRASQRLIDNTLDFYHCRKILVGDDFIDNVACFYECKVFGIDVNEHEGNAQGLLIERINSIKLI
jgi:hypothetical protein